MATCGVYVASDSAASLALAMPERDDAGHRGGHRGDGGHGAGAVPGGVADGVPRRRAAAAGPAAPGRPPRPGTSRIMPSTDDDRRAGDQQAAVAAAEVVARAAPATAPAMPTPSRTSPSSGERRLRLPVAAATGEDGHHVLTGGDAGRAPPRPGRRSAVPKPATRSDVPPGHVERAEPRVGEVLHDRAAGPSRRRRPGRRPSTDGDRRRGRAPPARMTRRACFGVPPLAAIRARVRGLPAGADREGRAGQQHHLEQRHHHDQHDDRDERVVGRGLPLRELGREHGVRGRVLDDRARQHGRADAGSGPRTSSQETGPPPTSQVA